MTSVAKTVPPPASQATVETVDSSFLTGLKDLLMWTNIYKTAMVFGVGFVAFLLMWIFQHQVIQIVFYFGLLLLVLGGAMVGGHKAFAALRGKPFVHPFPEVDSGFKLTRDQLIVHIDGVVSVVNRVLRWMKSVFFLRDGGEIAHAVFMMVLIAVSATLLGDLLFMFLVFLLSFTLPPLYARFHSSIDHANTAAHDLIMAKGAEKVSGLFHRKGKKKAE